MRHRPVPVRAYDARRRPVGAGGVEEEDRLSVAALWGHDSEELGAIEVLQPSPSLGLACGRGALPKPYAHLDPNEDAAAVAWGPDATVLVVADAHNGRDASEIAVGRVLDAVGDEPAGLLAEDVLVDLFLDIGRAIIAGTVGHDGQRRASRTTLALACIAQGRLQWASMGDSEVLVLGASSRGLTTPSHDFLGAPRLRHDVRRSLDLGTTGLADDDWVALVTDGFTNYTAAVDPVQGALWALAKAPAPGDAAGALVRHAYASGAGDNVAAAVLAPPVRVAPGRRPQEEPS